MEGSDGGDDAFDGGERDAVVDELEEAPTSACGADEIDGDGAWKREIDGRD